MHGACDPNLDVSALLSPLSLLCSFLGTPISQSALANAEGIASSVAAQTTVTVTHVETATRNNVAPTPVGPHTSGPAGTESVMTVTQTAPTPSTATQVGSATFPGSGPIITGGTSSRGSAYTST